MASVVKKEDEKNVMAGELPPARDDDEKDEREQERESDKLDYRAPKDDRAVAAASRKGFFTIYKRGQGYWTRMGTIIGAALVAFFTAHFIYQQLPVWLPEAWNVGSGLTPTKKVTLAACVGFLLVYSLFVYWITNKPTNVDFLIATDSEMKKVNWTSRKELIGSTKVVNIFMFLIAAILFVVDLFFGYVYYLRSVLKTRPF
jgi:preprotein translocase SecE subunit